MRGVVSSGVASAKSSGKNPLESPLAANLPAVQRSHSFQMYRNLFKDRISVDVDELLQQMPERFLLSNLDQIFLSWESALNELGGMGYLPALSDATGQKRALNYDHDHHKYRSDTYVETYDGNQLLCVKLANNGFMYPPDAHLIIQPNSTTARHRNTFVKLANAHKSDFKHLIQFAKAYLKSNVRFQLFYSFSADRMDFKAFDINDNKRGVVITYENLDPVDDLFDDDYWLLEDDEGSELA